MSSELARPAARSGTIGVSRQRLLGAFYTPDDFASALVKWAVDGSGESVLDPSYGGCSFLRTAHAEFARLGFSEPAERLFGTDIDPDTGGATSALRELGVPSSHLRLTDFLAIAPNGELPRCAAVVGNPPYVRHHWLNDVDNVHMTRIRETFGLSKRASAWAYFLLHSIDFVAEGGRMAMVLPGAALFADYSACVQRCLTEAFDYVEFVRVATHVFSDAQEDTVVLLASDRVRMSKSNLSERRTHTVKSVKDLAELQSHLKRWQPTPRGAVPIVPQLTGIPSYRLEELSLPVRNTLIDAFSHNEFRVLGAVASIRIGVVTGANRFFIRRLDEIPTEEGVAALPIVCRRSWLNEGLWSKAQQDRFSAKSERTFLLSAPPTVELEDASRMKTLVEAGEAEGLHQRSQCQGRARWWSITDRQVPDAFLPYMGAKVPSLVWNQTGALCTNAIHRVFWLDKRDEKQIAAAFVSSHSSLFRLAAVLGGRRYGGGLLKIEPKAASALPVFLSVHAASAKRDVLRELRRGKRTEASRIADSYVAEALGLTSRQVAAVRKEELRLGSA